MMLFSFRHLGDDVSDKVAKNITLILWNLLIYIKIKVGCKKEKKIGRYRRKGKWRECVRERIGREGIDRDSVRKREKLIGE